MNTKIFVNDLIKWNMESGDEIVERVLWIDTDSIITYVIDINEKQCLPRLKRVEEILIALKNGHAKKLDFDPFFKIVPDEEIEEKHINLRDQTWQIIEDLVECKNEPDIFERSCRRKMILNAAKQFNVSDRVIYKYLTRFWQRGKIKNALLPDFENSGGKGKERAPGTKKLGRPRKNALIVGKGINVDEATKKIFRVAISKYYDTTKENPVPFAYQMMAKEFYAENYRYEDGVKKAVLIPDSEIPTQTQFEYWYKKEQNIKESLIARKGAKKYALQNRAILGKSDAEVIGPGSKYQIDATVADVYLRSRYNRDWIIGRPVIYVVIDVFSRMITGLYIGLEGPSWIGAMMALANAFSDKVKYCKEYGINIIEEDWPCYHLPQSILGDRGELEGKMPETMIKSLGIRIDNTPSYRADWKGIVEQSFRLLNIHVKPLVPGFIEKDFRERGGKDYRLDSRLDIVDFTKIIIKSVLYYNNQHWMESYEVDQEMIAADLDPISRQFWNWGIKNRSGRLRSHPEDIVKLNLMPTGSATVTERGIRYKNMFYSCDKAVKEMWFERSRNKGSWKLNISYDPRNMNYVYIRSDDGRSFEKCHMLDQRKYYERTLYEILYLDAMEALKKEKNRGNALQSKVDLLSDIQDIISKAEKKCDELESTNSDTSLVNGIREKRRVEKLENQKDEAFELSVQDKSDNASVVIPITKDNSENLKYPSNIEFLRRKQRERMGKKDD